MLPWWKDTVNKGNRGQSPGIKEACSALVPRTERFPGRLSNSGDTMQEPVEPQKEGRPHQRCFWISTCYDNKDISPREFTYRGNLTESKLKHLEVEKTR